MPAPIKKQRATAKGMRGEIVWETVFEFIDLNMARSSDSIVERISRLSRGEVFCFLKLASMRICAIR
jgi:hypothetical protein